MDKRVEIISRVERRRQWPAEEKLRIMEEALVPGAIIAAVADRNGVCRSLLYTWRRHARTGRLRGLSLDVQPSASFVPVRIEGSARPAAPPSIASVTPSSRRRTSIVEIMLGNGRVVKVDEGIDPAALARLVTALDGGAL
jgi:transposase